MRKSVPFSSSFHFERKEEKKKSRHPISGRTTGETTTTTIGPSFFFFHPFEPLSSAPSAPWILKNGGGMSDLPLDFGGCCADF
jgi:hypothetical protein